MIMLTKKTHKPRVTRRDQTQKFRWVSMFIANSFHLKNWIQYLMDNYQKIISLFKSGRYEFDLSFYQELRSILSYLNLYEFIPDVEQNREILEQFEKLTREHLKILQNDDDEEAALEILQKANKCAQKTDASNVAHMVEIIEKMNGEGLEEKVGTLLKNQSMRKPYLQICHRICNSVHDEKMRLQDILLVGIFSSKNHEKLSNFIEIFKNVIENGVKELKRFRERRDFIESHPQAQSHDKVQNYLKGSLVILHKITRFNDIYKVLSGDNRYGLKINSVRKDVEEMNKNWEHYKDQSIDFESFKQCLIEKGEMAHVCSLCLLSAPADHRQCLSTIKLLFVQEAKSQ